MQGKIEIVLQPKILTPQCSCSKCDSVECFTKRRTEEPCTCPSCKLSRSCLFYNTNNNISNSSGSINSQDIEREFTPEIKAKEFYEFKRINSRESYNMHSRVFNGQSKEEEENIGSNDKDTSGLEVSVTCSGKDICQSAAELSAQIMDLSYKDFKNSYKSNLSSNIMKISPFNIFNRIKEVYKACSCKLCECIVGKSQQKDLCRCKPCDCNNCAELMRNVKSFSKSRKKIPDAGCACIRCDRSSCAGIGKKSTDANVCDCVGLLHHDVKFINSYSQACSCIPCQCIECKFLSVYKNKAMIVATVGEEYQQQNTCECSPCECFNCNHVYGVSNQHHEMSTSVNRHPFCHCEMCANEACVPDENQSCRCDRQSRVMSKPFQRDNHDYDIRRANVKYDGRRDYSNSNTIAMFALTDCPKLDKIKNRCDCNDCECIQCQYKESASSTRKSFFEPTQTYKLNNHSHECSCAPCECQICERNTNNMKSSKSCRCDICDCISCESPENCKTALQAPNEIKQPKSKYSAKGDCKCNPCACDDCEMLMSTCSKNICQCLTCKCDSCVAKENCSEKDMIYPIKRGERLTPTIFKNKTEDAFFESRFNTLEGNNNSFKHSTIFKSPVKIPSAFSAFENTKQIAAHNLYSQNFNRRLETVKRAHVSKDKNEIKENINMNITVKSNENSKKSEILTPVSRRGLPYWQSYGNEYANGILKFPTTTAKTCLNDIMQFDSFLMNDQTQNTKKQLYSEEKPKYTTPKADRKKDNIVGKSNESEFKPVIESNIYRNYFSDSMSLIKDVKDDNVLRNTGINFENYSKEKVGNFVLKYCPSINKKKDIATENKIGVSDLKLVEDYERVQNTLHEARIFSLHLIKLLKRYEKANQEFESVSDKINNSLLVNNAKTGWKKIQFATDEMPTKEVKSNTSIGSSTEELVDINGNARLRGLGSVCERNILSENPNNSKCKSYYCEELTDIIEENEPINEEARQKQGNNKKYITELHRKYNERFNSNQIPSAGCVKVDASIATEDIKQPIQTTLNDAHIIKKLQNLTRDGININNNENENCLKRINKSITEPTPSVTEKCSKDTKGQHLEVEISKHPNKERESEVVDINSAAPWLMKKNVSLNMHANEANRRILMMSPMEKSIKDTVQAIKVQQETENATYIYKNNALVKLHSEVRKLLDMPMLQNREPSISFEKTIPDNWKTSVSQNIKSADDDCNAKAAMNNVNISTSFRKSCDAFKVNSLHVRRVSDHTVLVKWDAPRTLENVKGYELLVDGRAVQKILSPSRRMAVVTCLPHTDKILLTVRTVMNPPCHHLACTVVYQPRNKFY